MHYRDEEIPSGVRVRVESTDPFAIAAVHDFLRVQTTDHQTGDRVTAEDAH